MKIVVCYETNCSGETIATESICRELRKNRRIKLRVIQGEPLRKTNFVGYFSWLVLGTLRWVIVIVKAQPADIVYTTTYTAGVAAAVLKGIYGYRLCFHYHGSRIPDPGRSMTQRIKRAAALFLHSVCFAAVDVFFVPSQYSKNTLLLIFPFIQHEQIVVVLHGVDATLYYPLSHRDRLTYRRSLAIAPNQYMLLYSGRIDARKRLGLLIKSFHVFLKKKPEAQLLLAVIAPINAAETAYKQKIEALIHKLGIEKRVRWFMDYKEMNALYNAADLVVNVSKDEQLPLVMFEALACGVPIASTSVGGVTEFLAAIDRRLLFSGHHPNVISRKIMNILETPDIRENIQKHRNWFIRTYSWKATTDSILRLLS